MSRPIKSFMENIIPEEHRWKLELFTQWNAIIGHLKNKVSIEKIDGDVLYLNVSHPAWAHELHLLSPLIKKKINSHFAEPKINTIRFRNRAQMATQKFFKKVPSQPTCLRHQTVILTDQENSILAPLASGGLQSIVAEYLMRCKTFKRSKDEKK